MKHAVIDIGTNSVRLLVAEQMSEGLQVIRKDLRMTRLGDGLVAGEVLGAEAQVRTRDGIAALVNVARECGAEQFIAVGTNAMRIAANGKEFAAELSETFGFPVRVLSGEEEARYSYLGASEMGNQLTAVVDLGGGSTEIGIGFGDELGVSISLPLGAVRGTRDYDMMTARGIAELKKHVFFVLAQNAEKITRVHHWIGVGGTMTTLAALDQKLTVFSPEAIQGYVLSHEAVRLWMQQLASMSYDERLELPGLAPERADIIVAGTVIVDSLMEYFAISEIIISDMDLLEGIWREEFGQ